MRAVMHDSDISFLAFDEVKRFDARCLGDLEADLRVLRAERAEQQRQDQRTDEHRHGDAQILVPPRELGDVAVEARDILEHVRDFGEERLPVRRQFDVPPDVAEQIEPRLALERLHREAQRRLRDVELRRRARDALMARDRLVIHHLLDCHARALLFCFQYNRYITKCIASDNEYIVKQYFSFAP